MKYEQQIYEVEQVVEDAAAFIASSNDRRMARVIIQDAIERQIQEIDFEARKFLGGADPDTE